MSAQARHTTSAATQCGFEHPSDGWYQIEAKGVHPNQRAGLVQIIDSDACQSIVNTFNREADKPGFPGMLIDHEHFSHQEDQETRGYGWLMRLQNRDDGIYGQIRWTGTGREAVDSGDYRFFSTEYADADLQTLNAKKPRQVRPTRLAGLTLTNVPNNKGQKPITNRNDMNTPITNATAGEPGRAAYEAREQAIDADMHCDGTPAAHAQCADKHRRAAAALEAAGQTDMAALHIAMAKTHEPPDESETPTKAGAANRGATSDEANLSTDDFDPADEQAKSARVRLEAEKHARATGTPFDQCLNLVRQAHPEWTPRPHPATVSNRQPYDANDPRAVKSREAKFMAEDLAQQTGQSFEKCWQIVKNRRPDLFGMDAGDDPAATAIQPVLVVRNGRVIIDNPDEIALKNRRAINDETLAIQRSEKCGYTQARERLRYRKPSLFGFSKEQLLSR